MVEEQQYSLFSYLYPRLIKAQFINGLDGELMNIKKNMLPAMIVFLISACKPSETNSVPGEPLTIGRPPPSLKFSVEGDRPIVHVAALVDGVANYLPLVLASGGGGFSCSSDTSLTNHFIAILDHRTIPDPVVVTTSGGSATNTQTGQVTTGSSSNYTSETITKGLEAIPNLKRVLEFSVDGSCNDSTVALKYSEQDDGSLLVTKSVSPR